MGSEHTDYPSIEAMLSDSRITGEKFYCYQTEKIRKFRFPQIKSAFIPEAQLLLRLPGKARVFNEVFRIYHADSIDNLTHDKWRKAWRGMVFYYFWLLTHKPYFFFASARKSLHRRMSW